MGLMEIFEKRKQKLKNQAYVALEGAKDAANTLNTCLDINEFCDAYEKVMTCLDKLIWLNEKKKVFMFPDPRTDKDKIQGNIENTIKDFMSRKVEFIKASYPIELWHTLCNSFFDTVSENSRIKSLVPDNMFRIVTDLDIQLIKDMSKICQRPVLERLSDIDHMEGHKFERWCAALLKKVGFSDVEVTPGSNDQGVDILAKKDGIKYAIQCKCYSSDLGNKPVQEVNTGKAIYRCQVGAVITNRHFTQGAKEAAEATGVLLWDREEIKKFLLMINNTNSSNRD